MLREEPLGVLGRRKASGNRTVLACVTVLGAYKGTYKPGNHYVENMLHTSVGIILFVNCQG